MRLKIRSLITRKTRRENLDRLELCYFRVMTELSNCPYPEEEFRKIAKFYIKQYLEADKKTKRYCLPIPLQVGADLADAGHSWRNWERRSKDGTPYTLFDDYGWMCNNVEQVLQIERQCFEPSMLSKRPNKIW